MSRIYRDISFWVVFETNGWGFFLDVLVGNFWNEGFVKECEIEGDKKCVK